MVICTVRKIEYQVKNGLKPLNPINCCHANKWTQFQPSGSSARHRSTQSWHPYTILHMRTAHIQNLANFNQSGKCKRNSRKVSWCSSYWIANCIFPTSSPSNAKNAASEWSQSKRCTSRLIECVPRTWPNGGWFSFFFVIQNRLGLKACAMAFKSIEHRARII